MKIILCLYTVTLNIPVDLYLQLILDAPIYIWNNNIYFFLQTVCCLHIINIQS